jgi:hypothetical protein
VHSHPASATKNPFALSAVPAQIEIHRANV